MSLCIIRTFFVYFMCGSCIGLTLYERAAELLEGGDALVEESSPWRALLQERPGAVLVELQAPLLDRLKGIVEDDSSSDEGIGPTTLATYDSKGLQEVFFCNDSSELRQTIMSLQPTVLEREMFSPAFHALGDLLQRGPPQGSVLLVTWSKPSDEDFLEAVLRSLIGNKIQLSVLWAGDDMTDDYLLLQDATMRTGGKFKFFQSNTENIFNLNSANFSGNIKFPTDQNESSEEMPLVSRAADQRVFQKAVVPLIVEVASGSTLEVKPGTPTQIQFTVKNNINVAIQAHFNAKYNGIAQIVQPVQALLQPSASTNVIINLQPIGLAQDLNAVGTVTLFAGAANKVTARSAIISLTPQTISDNYPPKMTYKYEGDCSNYREPQNCENGHWGLEARFHDEETGLLKILSEPYGLVFQSEFVAGTKTPVTVYYSATCCQPNAYIWAEDLRGNYVKRSFDVFNQNLLAGEIASIVLGILIIIFIIIAVVVAVILYKKRNQRNLIIPRARSGSR